MTTTMTPYVFRRKKFPIKKFILLLIFTAIGIIISLVNQHNKKSVEQQHPIKSPADYFALILVLGFFVFIFVRWLIGFLTKITISESGISCKNFNYSWNQIHSYGMFVIGKYYHQLNKEQFLKKFWIRDKYMWIALPENYTPNRNETVSENYLCFVEDEKAWALIQKQLQRS